MEGIISKFALFYAFGAKGIQVVTSVLKIEDDLILCRNGYFIFAVFRFVVLR